jgi:hypothetical protein
MFGGYRSDIWHSGILHAPIARVLSADALHSVPITWLPTQKDFCFLADPFALWHGARLHVLAEHYDYREKRGTIRYFSYDRDFNVVDDGEALAAPYHLSYPFLIQDGADIYMVPEAHQSGALSLYRARRFPNAWDKVCDLISGPIVDASIIKHQDQWIMFYALEGPDKRAMRELHLATAPHLTGPWTTSANNPVATGFETSRPGGTPFVQAGELYLPVQDCRDDYGAALSVLHIESLKPFAAKLARKLLPTDIHTAHTDGLHTLSACGDVTLFDAKHIERSGKRAWINLQRRIRRLIR